MVFAALAIATGRPAAAPQAGGSGQGMMMPPGGGMPMYDKATEATIVGVVDKVIEEAGMMRGRAGMQGAMGGAMTGIHVMLKTDAGDIEVHLGPSTFLKEKELTVATGDRLEVIGSKVTMMGAPAFLARQVKKGDATVVLRDESGRPLWAMGRGRGR